MEAIIPEPVPMETVYRLALNQMAADMAAVRSMVDSLRGFQIKIADRLKELEDNTCSDFSEVFVKIDALDKKINS